MMRVHLVYPTDPDSIAAPWTIGNHLLHLLVARGYTVSVADWADKSTARPDALIGHPYPEAGRAFDNSAEVTRSRARIAIAPWNGDPEWEAAVDELFSHRLITHFAGICGPYWESRSPWTPDQFTRIDVAADASLWRELPRYRDDRILYVGCCLPSKGTDYLAAISELAPELEFFHIGPGRVGGRVHEVGYYPNGSWRHAILEQGIDPGVIIACGRNDANPVSLLEGALLGMTAVCTPTSGWGTDLALHIPADDARTAADLLRSLPAGEVHISMREQAMAYSWQRFAVQVGAVLERYGL